MFLFLILKMVSRPPPPPINLKMKTMGNVFLFHVMLKKNQCPPVLRQDQSFSPTRYKGHYRTDDGVVIIACCDGGGITAELCSDWLRCAPP